MACYGNANSIEVSDKLDSDGNLKIDVSGGGYEHVEERIDFEDAVKLIAHLQSVFEI